MTEVKKSPFRLVDFHVADFLIKRQPKDQGPLKHVEINPAGVWSSKNKSFTLFLEVKLEDENESFKIELSALGQFKFKNLENLESVSDYFFVNAPAIIFPYLRSYIAGVTSLTGLPVVHLPIMNLSSLTQKLKDNTSGLEELSSILSELESKDTTN